MMKLIDLHTHSFFSDGSMSPTELITHAKSAGLSAVALTDHDTTDGIKEALRAGELLGIEVIAGVEISAVSEGETHILGYNIDIDEPTLKSTLQRLKELRLENNRRTAEAIQKLGFDVTIDDARALSPRGILGRAHFAKVMMNKGYVSSVKEAFDLYLQKGRPAYNSLRLLEPEDAIRIIHQAGGKAFLAHLHLTKLSGKELDQYVARLAKAGLDGIEGYYTDYTEDMEKEYRALAKKYSLLISGGTDFHGTNKPHISIGNGYGQLQIPYSIVEDMRR